MNPFPFIVIRVPPPVPPRLGLIDVILAVNEALYVNKLVTTFELTVRLTGHCVSETEYV